MAAAAVDRQLDEMDKAFERVQSAQGSAVKLPSAELNLLAVLERLREAMLDALMATDRAKLTDIFGCAKQAGAFADECFGSEVLVDLGYTEELYKAEHDEKVALAKRLGEETSGSDDDDDDEGDEEDIAPAAEPDGARKASAPGGIAHAAVGFGIGKVAAGAAAVAGGATAGAAPPDTTMVTRPGQGGKGGAGALGADILVSGSGMPTDVSTRPAAAGVENGGHSGASAISVHGIPVSDGRLPTDISKRPGADAGAVDGMLVPDGGLPTDTSVRPAGAGAVDGILVPEGGRPTDTSTHPAVAGADGDILVPDGGRPTDISTAHTSTAQHGKSGADGKKGRGRGGTGGGAAYGGGHGAGRGKGGASCSTAGTGKGYTTTYDGVPVMMCMRGCGRAVAPGVTRTGRPFDTCCRGCAMGREHDVNCQRVDPRKVGEGMCKMGCGRKAAQGTDSSGQKLETCCHGCATGGDHDEMCGKDVGDMFVPYIAISGDGFFRDARAALDAVQLNQLLEHIRMLNRGQESPEEATAGVKALFMPGHPELAKTFVTMVENAPKVKLEGAKKGAGRGRGTGGKGRGRKKLEHGGKKHHAGKKDDGSKRKDAPRDELRAKLDDRMGHVKDAIHRATHGHGV